MDGVRIGATEELQRRGMLLGKVGDLPVMVVRDGDEVYAIEDRCPHLGFPLHRGTVECGMVTCHWHHARFDLASGCTLDPWADDAVGFDATVDGDAVYVRRRGRAGTAVAAQRLREGIEQGLTIVVAKAVLALAEEPGGVEQILRIGADFGSRQRADGWGSGMTVLTCMANVLAHLDPADRPRALVHALVFLGSDVRGNPPRFEVPPLGAGQPAERLGEWYRRFVETREPDGASRALATLVAGGALDTAEAAMAAAVTDHVYLDTGHTLDFTNKAWELLSHLGPGSAEVLVSLVDQTCAAERAEETSEWNHPLHLAGLVEAHAEELARTLAANAGSGVGTARVADLAEDLLAESPDSLVKALFAAAGQGATAEEVARAVAYAAALRLMRFATNNDPGDWDTVHHTFTFANAVHQFVVRGNAAEVGRAILHGALRVYLDRFLNVPPARLPQARTGDVGAWREVWDVQGRVDAAGNAVAGFVRGGGSRGEAIAALGRAVLDEDSGFHTYQGFEAAVRQSLAWPEGSDEATLVLAAFARFLAAHTPTRRELPTVIRTAARLRRGEALFEPDPDQVPPGGAVFPDSYRT